MHAFHKMVAIARREHRARPTWVAASKNSRDGSKPDDDLVIESLRNITPRQEKS